MAGGTTYRSAAGGAGGLAASGTGTIKLDGGDGSAGVCFDASIGIGGGAGGDCPRFGAGAPFQGTSAAGIAAKQYGGGGGGAFAFGANRAGGAGAKGVCVVTEFY